MDNTLESKIQAALDSIQQLAGDPDFSDYLIALTRARQIIAGIPKREEKRRFKTAMLLEAQIEGHPWERNECRKFPEDQHYAKVQEMVDYLRDHFKGKTFQPKEMRAALRDKIPVRDRRANSKDQALYQAYLYFQSAAMFRLWSAGVIERRHIAGYDARSTRYEYRFV